MAATKRPSLFSRLSASSSSSSSATDAASVKSTTSASSMQPLLSKARGKVALRSSSLPQQQAKDHEVFNFNMSWPYCTSDGAAISSESRSP